MATFYNQASLSLGGSVINSNITEGEIVSGAGLTKTAASANYGPGDGITYVVSIVNNGVTEYSGLTLTDDLGRFTAPGGIEVVPLTFVQGSVLYYIDGVLQPAPEAEEVDGQLLVRGINVPAGGNVTVIYEARANGFAPLGAAASITNTVTAGGTSCELSDSATVPTRDEPSLTISKSVCPQVVTCSGEVTYTIVVQNSGNTAVVATDNLIVSDLFNPLLSDITVTINGEALADGTGYTYNTETGEFATLPGAVPVPAATFTRDPVTGLITTTPGVAVITVTGNI